ncbi:endonuclease/exonuclease/phosphatase family protein [Streptomyces sp. NPDC047315]|uniref:endonuclease/exonuclease/phosphatase family protein n=1 Tax=Streptomyces sp. NPDC047315 TaxID=3155142 RepID=UPI0033EA2399
MIRAMTWNVWWRFGPRERRREALARVLEETRPDVVGLQEVWFDETGDGLANRLAERLGMHVTVEPYRRPERWHRRAGDEAYGVGLAVLSRWPVLEREVLALPAGDGQDDGRIVLHALLDAPTGALPFFTTHLNSAPHESAVRCEQVTALASFVASRARGHAFPPVLTGDYNALPDADEMRLLGGYRTAPAVGRQVLLDAWEHAEPGAPAATWDAANPYVARTFPLSSRVDYVHVGLTGPGGLGRVHAVRRAGDRPVDDVWPSDHAAVVADLTSYSVDPDVELPQPEEGERWAVGALIRNERGEVFAQKRGPHRRLFPNSWDVVGGHVEAGEDLLVALAREVEEETGWHLRRVRRLIGVSTWTGDDGEGLRHEADFVVDVAGDPERPVLEAGKHTEYGWFGVGGLERLKENRPADDTFVHDLVAAALA